MSMQPPAGPHGPDPTNPGHTPIPSPDTTGSPAAAPSAPTPPRTAVNPLTAADVDAAFAQIAAELRNTDAQAFTLTTPAKKPRIVPVEAPANLVVDLALGILSDPGLALCQMCLTGLVDVRTRRVCAHCVRVDRLLARRFSAGRFLPTTRRAGEVNRCQMVRKHLPRILRTLGDARIHRTAEREIWQQMQQLFENNLRLLASLRGVPTAQPMPYPDWAEGHAPSLTRSMDAYLAYALLHAPWALQEIRNLIIDNEGRLA